MTMSAYEDRGVEWVKVYVYIVFFCYNLRVRGVHIIINVIIMIMAMVKEQVFARLPCSALGKEQNVQ